MATRDIAPGKVIEMADLTFKRPAHGISPRSIDELLGKTAKQAIAEDAVLQWGMFE